MTEHYEFLQKMYYAAPLHQSYPGIDISISDAKAVISLDIDEKFHHAGGSAHGSVIFKLLDDAAYFAVQSNIKDYFIVTSQFNIQLFRPVITGKIIATGEIEMMTRNLFSGKSVITDEKGRKVAVGQGQFVKSSIALSEKLIDKK